MFTQRKNKKNSTALNPQAAADKSFQSTIQLTLKLHHNALDDDVYPSVTHAMNVPCYKLEGALEQDVCVKEAPIIF